MLSEAQLQDYRRDGYLVVPGVFPADEVERLKEHFMRLRAAGAYETVIAPQIRATGWHLLGTAKMGTDPATAVVDAWGRTHDVPNLFVFDGSVWPTTTAEPPSPSI